MQAFFSDEQLLHEPRQFMRLGRISAPTDLPSRAGSLQAALAARHRGAGAARFRP